MSSNFSMIWMMTMVIVMTTLSSSLVKGVEGRKPGTLILTMLTRDEAQNLDRTLPKWAPIIDYYVIGIDEKNTDNSPEIIKKHLGHLPGEIVVVKFDGMGPTWTILVEKGLEKFPEATHGIIADADFAPMQGQLDKMQLDVRCSKHMFSIWTEDGLHERKLDWIYRNVKGARVERRVHQIVRVPPLPNQEVFQTLIDLKVSERSGGYQDRTGQKYDNYIFYLKKDLVEIPNDPRTLYYLAYAHFDKFLVAKDDPQTEHWVSLGEAVKYFKQRIDLDNSIGNFEEKWFATLKIAEIQERFYKDWEQAKKYYTIATETDPARCDAWFYLGQHYRLSNDPKAAWPYLKKGASLELPQRALFQWMELYDCLVHVELGRVAIQLPDLTLADLKFVRRSLNTAMHKCPSGTNKQDAVTYQQRITNTIRELEMHQRMSTKGGKKLAKFVASVNMFLDFVADSTKFLKTFKDTNAGKILLKQFVSHMDAIRTLSRSPEGTPCRAFRAKTTPYLKWFRNHGPKITKHFSDNRTFLGKWETINNHMLKTCRG